MQLHSMKMPGNGEGNLDMSLTFHVHLCVVFSRPQAREWEKCRLGTSTAGVDYHTKSQYKVKFFLWPTGLSFCAAAWHEIGCTVGNQKLAIKAKSDDQKVLASLSLTLSLSVSLLMVLPYRTRCSIKNIEIFILSSDASGIMLMAHSIFISNA